MPATKLIAVASKVEAAVGTAETLSVSDAGFLAFDIQVPDHIVENQLRPVAGTMSKLSSVAGARSSSLSFKTYVHGKGSSGVPAWASSLLIACGMYDDSNTMKLASTMPGVGTSDTRTVTQAVYIDGVRYQLNGAQGNAKLIIENGKQPWIEWEFMGKYSAFADVAMIAPTLPTVAVIRAANLTVTWGSFTPRTARIEIDLGNKVELRPDVTTGGGTSGYHAAYIMERDPTVTITMETPLVATEDLMTKSLSKTSQALLISLDGVALAWNTLNIAAPATIIRDLKYSEGNKILMTDIVFELDRSAANDDELTIEFAESP